MYSPVFPSSPVCEECNISSTFSSSHTPRRRSRTLSMGAAALSKGVRKLANATFAKISSQKPKAALVPTLPSVLPTSVSAYAEPFIRFFQTMEADEVEQTLPCLSTSAALEELLESIPETSTTCIRGPLDGLQAPVTAPSLTHADQPPSLCSSPTSSSGCSSMTMPQFRSDGALLQLSTLLDAPSPQWQPASVNPPPVDLASPPYPHPSIPTSALLSPVSARYLTHISSLTTVTPCLAPHSKCGPLHSDSEPWRQNVRARPLAAKALFVEYEFLLSPPQKTRRLCKRASPI